MSPPTKELMKLVLEEKLAHGGILFFAGALIIFLFALTRLETSSRTRKNQPSELTER